MTPDNHAALQVPQYVDDELLMQLSTLNLRGLQVLRDTAEFAHSALAHEWQQLDGDALARVADAPYLLFELDVAAALVGGNVDTRPELPAVADASPNYGAWAAAPGRLFAATVLQFAWHVARSRPSAAPFVLGLPFDACHALRAGDFRGLDWSATQATRWVALRWPDDRAQWAQRLRAAQQADRRALRANTLAGLQRLAGRRLHR